MKFIALLTVCAMLPAVLGAAISDFSASMALDVLPANDGNATAFVPTLDTAKFLKEIGLDRRGALVARQSANQILETVRTVVGSIARSSSEAGGNDDDVSLVHVDVRPCTFRSHCAALNFGQQKRSRFTTEVVTQCRRIWPQFNWVAAHTAHQARWDGRQGEEWNWVRQELSISLGRTIGCVESPKFAQTVLTSET